MYRYLIFGFSNYYPGGGMSDCNLKTNDSEEVNSYVKQWAEIDKGKHEENLQVYDSNKDKIIYDAHFNVHDYMDDNARELVVNVDNI